MFIGASQMARMGRSKVASFYAPSIHNYVIQVTFAKSPHDRKNQWTFKKVSDGMTLEVKALEQRVRRQIEESTGLNSRC